MLKSIWTNVTEEYSSNTDCEALWQEINSSYSSANRHYHDHQHLQHMITLAEEFREHIDDFQCLLFSIFYHDIVYDAKKSDNEERSADIAMKRLSEMGLPTTTIQKCSQQILATKDHEEGSDNDTNLLLDIDVSILGSNQQQYEQYASDIRKEYNMYPNVLYKRGRKKVLRHFLDMEYLFKTEAFRNRFEKQARKNIQAELNTL